MGNDCYAHSEVYIPGSRELAIKCSGSRLSACACRIADIALDSKFIVS